MDGNIIEIGETMESVVWRLHEQRFSMDSINEKTGMPHEFIERVIQEHASDQPSGG